MTDRHGGFACFAYLPHKAFDPPPTLIPFGTPYGIASRTSSAIQTYKNPLSVCVAVLVATSTPLDLTASPEITDNNAMSRPLQSVKCLPASGSGRASRAAAKRCRTAQRTALERITKGSIRRLARRGGVVREFHPPLPSVLLECSLRGLNVVLTRWVDCCAGIAGTVYEESRFILRDFLTVAIRDAIVYSRKAPHLPPAIPALHLSDLDPICVLAVEHCNRKTVQTMDVIYALKLRGRTLYHF